MLRTEAGSITESERVILTSPLSPIRRRPKQDLVTVRFLGTIAKCFRNQEHIRLKLFSETEVPKILGYAFKWQVVVLKERKRRNFYAWRTSVYSTKALEPKANNEETKHSSILFVERKLFPDPVKLYSDLQAHDWREVWRSCSWELDRKAVSFFYFKSDSRSERQLNPCEQVELK